MATVDFAVERLDSSGFFGLSFGILNFFTVFQLLDVPLQLLWYIVLPSRKKQQNVSNFYFMSNVSFEKWFWWGVGREGVSGWGGGSRLDFQFQLNILVEQLLLIRSISVLTKNIHVECKITITCLKKTCK